MGKSKHATLTQRKKNQERMASTELILAEEMQVYGQVARSLGDKRFECICNDHKVRICKVRGKFRGRLFINQGDYLLIALREEEDDKADIIHKYTTDEAHELFKMGEVNERDFTTQTEESAQGGDDNGVIVWTKEDVDNI
ncbi:Eukaryotic initiation factor 1A family protein [Trichomonas vaginalis G3]|uniref:Eukaryotic initiation factor 1A family protein n=1 Tax=Trichomonas vaginalis (strain ATCC PRA-98 / G3) TaxID=412133 RepID=A2F1G9_TRIV3|nr:translation initiation factor protein [Trichomonas vaginalis G3]EAY01256.1 Eukaryotic initiation factor 1A family protein [Trichomonas vaginalis G3]KAI5486997.1 translation initiation factor protein [Trichomonas vaginalis G3]|eukprot:XP_001314071.1 Eukaryotic initiation factor 1A family protein [Trichomonas vaginalis G3]